MPRTKKPSDAATEKAFREVNENEPKIVEHTREKFGAKRAAAQKTAITLDKARRADEK